MTYALKSSEITGVALKCSEKIGAALQKEFKSLHITREDSIIVATNIVVQLKVMKPMVGPMEWAWNGERYLEYVGRLGIDSNVPLLIELWPIYTWAWPDPR